VVRRCDLDDHRPRQLECFLWPLVIGQDQDSWTVQIALSTFLTQQTNNLHKLFIAAVVSILRLLLMFLFLQRWIVQGVECSGINE
jgi:multiple sugar transport system permease protein